MAVLKVLEYPDPILSAKAKPLGSISKKDLELIRDMIDTMYREDGVGLAAPQVGISKRIIVISPNARRGEEEAYINPEILESSKEQELGLEGCLSVPGISCEVRRAQKIKFKALTPKGNQCIQELDGFPARVVQHEIDHLNGILLIDRLDFNKRQAVLSAHQRL